MAALNHQRLFTGKVGQITLAAVGKLRGREWRSAQADYLKRLGHYTDMQIVEVKDAVGRGYPDVVAIQREGEQLLAATGAAGQRILLTADGRQMSSEELAAFLAKQLEIYGKVAFILGGPLGFSQEVEDAVPSRLSLSRLTFPHELARIVFLEQVYRAFTILRGEKYHK